MAEAHRHRRSGLRTYLGPLVLFVGVIGIAAVYRANRTPEPEAGMDRDQTRSEGTAVNRDAVPIDELGGVFEPHGGIGRRIQVDDVDVERIESPTVFWVRDGIVSIAVVAAESEVRVQPGHTVNVAGVVERAGNTMRIRASRIEGSK